MITGQLYVTDCLVLHSYYDTDYADYKHRGISKTFEVSLPRLGGAFDLRLAVSVPLPIVIGIFVLLWFQSRLT